MKYFARINNEQIGPCEIAELVELGLKPDTWVWCKGMADWQQAKDVADICRFFRRRIFDLMHPSASAESLPSVPASGSKIAPAQGPMSDEDYKGLKRRDFYNAVGTQIQQHAVNPDQEKIERGEAPTPLPAWLTILSLLLFFPLGIAAYMSERHSKQLWHKGAAQDSYEASRSARMYAGIAIAIGVIAISILVQWLTRT